MLLIWKEKKGPYDQFKFPRTDPPLTEAGKLKIPKIESLEYIVNLLAGKLQPDLKNIWDQLSGRDVSKTEISKSGMQLTGYDIKIECAIYKKACEKARYVTSLTDTDKVTHNNISTQAAKTDCQVLASRISQTDVINFRNPTEGPLSEILLQCGFDQQSFLDCLFQLFYKSKTDLLTLLDEIEKYMIFKKHKKKLQKFKKLIECGEKAQLYKVNYFMKFISRIVQQRKRICSNIKIRSLYSNGDCCDCPQVFLTLGNSTQLYTALLDTGAQSSLIGYSCLTNFGYTEKEIKKSGLSLNLESTTGIVNDAIMGTITVQAYIMLRKKFTNNARNFGKTSITFLVASPEVQLTRIIIGTPWLRFAQTQMFLSKDKVKARIHCENSEHLCSLQLKTSQKLKMVSENEVTEANSSATFQLNAFFLQDQVSFKVHDKKVF